MLVLFFGVCIYIFIKIKNIIIEIIIITKILLGFVYIQIASKIPIIIIIIIIMIIIYYFISFYLFFSVYRHNRK